MNNIAHCRVKIFTPSRATLSTRTKWDIYIRAIYRENTGISQQNHWSSQMASHLLTHRCINTSQEAVIYISPVRGVQMIKRMDLL